MHAVRDEIFNAMVPDSAACVSAIHPSSVFCSLVLACCRNNFFSGTVGARNCKMTILAPNR